MKQTSAELMATILTLEEYLSDKQPDSVHGYFDIQNATGVIMNLTGKSCLRRALKRLKVEYSTMHNYGIRLAGVETAMPIMGKRVDKVRRTVKRASKTQKRLSAQFGDQLPEDARKRLNFAGAVLGALELASDQGKQINSTKQRFVATTVHIPLPLM